LDFSTNSYEFPKLADLKWGVLIFHRKAPGKIEILAIGSFAGLNREADQRRPNSGEGKVGEKVQGLTTVTGVAGVEEERG
jgi:hypothetical protein